MNIDVLVELKSGNIDVVVQNVSLNVSKGRLSLGDQRDLIVEEPPLPSVELAVVEEGDSQLVGGTYEVLLRELHPSEDTTVVVVQFA